jgi:single-strand DNA-binding protein
MDGLHVAFTGRLGGDPETRFLQNGSEVLQFSIVPNDSKTPEAAPEWIRVSIFTEKLTEDTAAKLSKGAEAYIEGRLQVGRWQGQDGTPRTGLRVNAWTVQPMGQIGRRAPGRRPAHSDGPAMMPQHAAIPRRSALSNDPYDDDGGRAA